MWEAREETVAAVLDTNVVLDWLVFDDPALKPVAAAIATGRLRWIATRPMLDELRLVLTRPGLERWQAQRERALAFVEGAGCLVEMPAAAAPAPVCRDPSDQMFIDLALAWRARWLLSRDKALLRLARRAREAGTTVCTPAGWRDGD